MAYIDTTYVDNAISQALRQKLTPDTASFNQLVSMAEAEINSALKSAGYPAPITGTAPDDVKLATFGAFLRLAYGRAQLDPPLRYAPILDAGAQIRAGTYPILSMTPSAAAGVGGVTFTESDARLETSAPQVFGAAFLRWVP